MRAQELQAGAVSSSTRVVTTLALVLLAGGLRVLTQLRSGESAPDAPVSLPDFLLSPRWPWIDPPLPDLILAISEVLNRQWLFLLVVELVATAIVVITLLRLGERWLDFDAAVLGAGLWAVAAPAVAVFEVPGVEGWQAALAILVAGAMMRTARRREPKLALRIGLYAGLLTLFSGGGLLWAIAAVAWLPATSNRFRRRGFAWTLLWVVVGWTVIVTPVAVRNAVVGNGDPQLPVIGDLARMHAAARTGTVAAPPLPAPTDSVRARPASARYAERVLERDGRSTDANAWSRGTDLVALTLEEATDDGGRGWAAALKRFVAAAGGWTPPARFEVLALPWLIVVLFAWCGVVAMLPSARQFFPLLLGGAVPILQGMVLGIDTGTLLAASPFVSLYAGYAMWRVWTGRRWMLTWVVVPAVLAVALAVHFVVRDWS